MLPPSGVRPQTRDAVPRTTRETVMTNGAHPEGAKGSAAVKDGEAQATAAGEKAKASGEAKQAGPPKDGTAGK